MHPNGGAVHHRVVVALRFLWRHLRLTVTTVLVLVVFSLLVDTLWNVLMGLGIWR